MKPEKLKGIKSKAGITMIVMLIACLVSISNVAAKTTTLKLSSFLPPVHPGAKLTEEMCQELTDASDGTFVVKHYGSSSLGPAAEQYDLVVEGMADAAITCCSFTPNRFPMALGAQLPYFSDSALTGAKIVAELMKRGFFTDEFCTSQMAKRRTEVGLGKLDHTPKQRL